MVISLETKKKVLFFFLILIFSFSLSLVSASHFTENLAWGENLTNVTHPSLAFGDIDNDGDLDLALAGCSYIISGWTCTTSVSKIYINNGTTLTENQTWQSNLTAMSSGSLAFGDIDNDGDLDLALGGCSSGGGYSEQCSTYVAKIYINNGTTLIENSIWQQNLTGINLEQGALAFGDIDNDGDLDLALTGADSSSENGIYINNGSSFVKSSTWLESLPFVGQGYGSGSLALGDINNDEDLDLIVMGSYSTNFYAQIYISNKTSLVENSTWEQNIGDQLGWPSIALGDYNDGGTLDMVYIGARAGDHIKFFNNSGNTFVLSQENLPANNLVGIFAGAVAWGDYDNDGDLDLAANGRETYTDIYTNEYGIFDRNTTEGDILVDLRFSFIAFGDIDNDGDLDLVESGDNNGIFYTLIYTSNRSLTKANTQPNAPTTFNSTYSSGQVTLNWSQGTDSETPQNGLYYNLKVGNCSGCQNIVSGVYGGSSNPTAGYFGNMMQRRNITLSGSWLQSNTTYFWSVQTIDTALAKSSWSAEQNFTTPLDVDLPNITLNVPPDNNYTSNLVITFNATVSDETNLTNVTLWGNWGGWHANETNSSGVNADYVFIKNMSDQGAYQWKIHACDNSSNCVYSSTRGFTVDLFYPQVTLLSPSNGATWTSSSTVTFSYNVSDIDIANCSLILNGAVDQTDTDVEVDTTQTFTKSLNNGDYTWQVNCSDYLSRQNSSDVWSLTVSYNPPSNGGTGGGGGGAVVCVENWFCVEWSGCINGSQTRNCTDMNKCETIEDKPAESRACGMPVPEENVTEEVEVEEEVKKEWKKWSWLVVLAVAVVIAIVAALILAGKTQSRRKLRRGKWRL